MALGVPLEAWRPSLPAGDLRSISLHWTAAGYSETFEAYHFCLTGPRSVRVHATHDLTENMRDVRLAPGLPYAAHTRGRNSWSAGIALAAMRDATPADFGSYPLTPELLEGACRVAAVLATAYAIPTAAIRTHAEAALDDGYFGADGDDVRWDIARLAPSPEPLVPAEAVAAGAWFRARVESLRRGEST